MKLLVLLLLLTTHAFARTQLNTSIIMSGLSEIKKLPDSIGLASSLRNTTVNLIPTIYASLNSDNQVTQYFYKDLHGKMQPMDQEFIKQMTASFAHAMSVGNFIGIQYYITPHLDDVNLKVWRHHFQMDPLEKHHGFSYFDIIINPIAKVFSRSKKIVHFALFGEMGRTLRNSWKSYTKIMKDIHDPIKVGVSFNFTNILGDKTSSVESTLGKRKFFKTLDFIGFSNYMSVPVDCTKNDFQLHVDKFRNTLGEFGVSKRIPLHFNEVGIGGGATQNDLKTIANSAEEAAKYPYSGLSKTNPWEIPELNEMRHKYHACLMDFLNDDKVTAAFLWNLNSWDPQGIYSYNLLFKDQTLIDNIKTFNTLR